MGSVGDRSGEEGGVSWVTWEHKHIIIDTSGAVTDLCVDWPRTVSTQHFQQFIATTSGFGQENWV